MNTAAISAIMQLFDNSDKKRREEKEADRKYQEGRQAIAWQREEGLKKSEEFRAENERMAASQFAAKNPVKANDVDTFKKTGQVYNLTADDFKYRPVFANWAQEENAKASALPVEDYQKYRTTIAKGAAAFSKYGDQLGTSTLEDFYAATGGDFSTKNIESQIEAKTGIEKGRPALSVDKGTAVDRATIASANRSEAENKALLPNAGRAALSKQTAELVRDTYGGQSPSEAFLNPKQSSYTTVSPTGEVTVQRNPYFKQINPSPLDDMMSANNGLGAIAEQLGMEKYPMKFNTSGMPVRPTRTATKTEVMPEGATNKFGAGFVYPATQTQTNVVPKEYEQYRSVLLSNLPGVQNRTAEEQALIDRALAEEYRKKISGYRYPINQQKLEFP